MTRLNDQRRMWKYILFGILTFGIYDIYLEWTMINDLNTACGYKEGADDSSRSPHYLIRWLLSIVTFSIYMWVWYYKQGNRLKNVGEEYGVKVDEKGSTYILWMLLGGWFFGVGILVGLYLFMCNVNKVCHAYNMEIEGGRGGAYGSGQQGMRPEPPLLGDPYPNPYPGNIDVTMPSQQVGTLKFISGEYAGAVIEIRDEEEITLGRNQNMCQLVFSERDISRVHCVIRYSSASGYYYVTDCSTYGTIMNDSVRLKKNVETRCAVGTKLTLGNGDNVFTLR